MRTSYKLEAKVPGVAVTLMPNPLNAKVELTEAAKREFILLCTLQNLFGNYIYSAYARLAGEAMWTGNKVEPEKALWYLKTIVDAYFDSGDESSFETWKKLGHGELYLDELNSEHCGDCTCVAMSCSRCHAEGILGIDTLMSGKHVNCKLTGLWHADHEACPQSVRDERDRRSAELQAKYPDAPKSAWVPDKRTKQRWADEGAEAEQVYARHKRLVAEQEAKRQEQA